MTSSSFMMSPEMRECVRENWHH